MDRSIKGVIREVNSLDKVVILVFVLFGLFYLLARNYSDFLGGTIGSLMSVVLFLCGQIIITLRSAYDKRRNTENWRSDVSPAFGVVQKSLEINLVLLSGSKALLEARDISYIDYRGRDFHNSFGDFLDKVAPMDFGSGRKAEGTIPFIARLRGFQKNVLTPIRDLVRWGLIMDRLYAEIDLERKKKRLAMTLLELVVSLYLTETERTLNRVLAGENVYEMPQELNRVNVGFVNIKYTSRKSGSRQKPQFVASTKVPPGVERLLKTLNSICSEGYDLSLISELPDYPFSKTAEKSIKDFCEAYLTMAWYHSVLNYLGWTTVEHLSEEGKQNG